MLKIQNALVALITANKTTLGLNTVKAYAGDLDFDDKITKLRDSLPACYILLLRGFPGGDAENEDFAALFDIVVITESKSFNQETKQNNNLQAVTDLCEYLLEDDNLRFEHSGEAFYMDLEHSLEANTIIQDKKYTAISITAKYRKS